MSFSAALAATAIPCDLITHQKPMGRALAGKRVFLISTGTDPELPKGFEVPFKRTSEYFSMEYMSALYVVCKGDMLVRNNQNTDEFLAEIAKIK